MENSTPWEKGLVLCVVLLIRGFKTSTAHKRYHQLLAIAMLSAILIVTSLQPSDINSVSWYQWPCWTAVMNCFNAR